MMDSSYNGDSETFNSISYADCAGIEIPKVCYIVDYTHHQI